MRLACAHPSPPVCCISLFCGTRITANLDGPESVREQGRPCATSSLFRKRELSTAELVSFSDPPPSRQHGPDLETSCPQNTEISCGRRCLKARAQCQGLAEWRAPRARATFAARQLHLVVLRPAA